MKDFNTLNDILDFAIEREQEAVDFYKHFASVATSNEMKEVFEQFAREEILHKARLIAFKETGIQSFSNEKVIDMKIADYVIVIQKSIEKMNYHESIVLAMQREKLAYRLYTKLAQQTNDTEMKKLFNTLAQEEAKHKLRFEIEYDDNVYKEN